MCRFIYLSYRIGSDTPLYPGTVALDIKKVKDMSIGDPCDTVSLTLSDHSGTHIDSPSHFLPDGKTIADYSMQELVFTAPGFIDCLKSPNESIGVEDLKRAPVGRNIDALLIRTGFGRYRESDPNTYCYHNPFFLPEAAEWIRMEFPRLRFLGIDMISFSCKRQRALGAQTHKILFSSEAYKGSPLLIAEDMDLPEDVHTLDQLVIMPIFKARIGGSPCSALGVLHD